MHLHLPTQKIVSAANDYGCVSESANTNDITNVLYLPTYAAAAKYHQKPDSPYQEMELEDFLAEVRIFAETEYLTALFKGSSLPAEEKDAVAEKLSMIWQRRFSVMNGLSIICF